MNFFQRSFANRFRKGNQATRQVVVEETVQPISRAQAMEFEIEPDDPLLAYLLSVSNAVEVEKLHLDSPVLDRLREADVKVIVPLISQGELIGLLNLGARRSEQEYSTDDRRLLNTLAAQAAPALRVAQLARQQQAEARERERLAQELRVARVIQQTLLPKEIPNINGWQMAAFWQPARAVSGDFYDFITFPDGRLAIIVGDVTDKGVPAALVMATTRSILRAAVEREVSPSAVLEHANNTLCPDIPPNMFVTCLYILLDPMTGYIRFANAGHNLPYQRTPSGVNELRARGMPLGLLRDMTYEEKEAVIELGDQLVLYSDGLVEAHSKSGDMFGFPRLRDLLAQDVCAPDLPSCLMQQLEQFTGVEWEQEDDVTIVSIERLPQQERNLNRTMIGAFEVASVQGNEISAMEQVAALAQPYLPPARLERLKTAVAEATMNAMEHGNGYQEDVTVHISILMEPAQNEQKRLVVRIRDHGGNQEPVVPETPDLDAKLAGLQSPRGWGLFLIKSMVDEMHVERDAQYHTLVLSMLLDGEA